RVCGGQRSGRSGRREHTDSRAWRARRAMTRKDKKVTVDIPIYFGTLTTVLVEDWDELKKIYPAQDTEYLGACYAAVVFTDEHTEDNGTHYVAAFCGRPEN